MKGENFAERPPNPPKTPPTTPHTNNPPPTPPPKKNPKKVTGNEAVTDRNTEKEKATPNCHTIKEEMEVRRFVSGY